MKPTWERGGLKFWRIAPQDTELFELVRNIVSKNYDQVAWSYLYPFSQPVEEGEELVVFGESIDRLIGGMEFSVTKGNVVANTTKMFSIITDPGTDSNNNEVTEDELHLYPGYKSFRGLAPICYLKTIVVKSPYKGRGFGTTAMKLLKSRGYELIELNASPDAKKFYLDNEFLDTTVTLPGGGTVMVWENPKYR